MRKLDTIIAYLEQSLISQGLSDKTDVIILSDHGMLTVTPRNFIDLFAFIDSNNCKCYGTSPVLQVICENGKDAEACKNLTDAANTLGTFDAYTDDQLPERWHVRNNVRFGPCVVVAKPYYAFQDMFELAEWFFDENGVKCIRFRLFLAFCSSIYILICEQFIFCNFFSNNGYYVRCSRL